MKENIFGMIISFLGMIVMLGIAFLLSSDRKKINWRMVLSGITLQILFAIIVLKTKQGEWFFAAINKMVVGLLNFTAKGSSFIFGGLVSDTKSFGFIFAFQVLPTIIFFSSLMSILYYLGIMQKVVQLVAKIIIKVMGTSGAETLSCSANIFVGQTEAPLLIKPYIPTMTKSELFAIMVSGFAQIAGGVMAAYVGMLQGYFPDIAGHLLTACVISAPGALVIAKIMIPETGEPETKGTVKIDLPSTDANVIEAAASGASTGLTLALNVGAMLIAFIALIALGNFFFEAFGNLINSVFGTHLKLSLDAILGTVFAPVAWILGVPWKDCPTIGNILGKMLVINEFVAYGELANILKDGVISLSPRSIVIVTYAICGFANISSIAIQIGGIGSLAPSRKSDLAKMGVYALIAGTLANYMTAAIAGFLTPDARITKPELKPDESLNPATRIVRYKEFPDRNKALSGLFEKNKINIMSISADYY